jgi:hypothetical protein
MQVPGGFYKRQLMQGTEAAGVITGATATGNGTAMTVTERAAGGFTTHTVQISGISGDTITFEANIDGTNWVAIGYTNLATDATATTATANGLYRTVVLGLVNVRARLTRVSGTVIVTGVMIA